MKGRRKVKTLKWSMKAVFSAEARSVLQSRCKGQQAGLLEIAAQKGRDMEPVGRLAGKW